MSIALPAVPNLADVTERYIGFGSVLTPPLGGEQQYIGRVGDRMGLDISLPGLSYEAARDWTAARIAAKTTNQTLTLAWPQTTTSVLPVGAEVDGAGQAGSVLAIKGLPAGLVLKKLTFFSFVAGGRHYLHVTTQQIAAGGDGKAVLPIGPMLRAIPDDATALEFVAPVLEGMVDGANVEWTIAKLTSSAGFNFTMSENA